MTGYPKKRGWQLIPENDRRFSLFEEVYARAISLNIVPENLEKPLLYEMKNRSLGKCSWRKRDGRIYAYIGLNACLKSVEDEKIRSILVHEIAHACTTGDHHGEEWYSVANFLGRKWGLKVERCTDDPELIDLLEKTNPNRYEVYCPKCGKTWRYKYRVRIIQEPQKWRCPYCNSPLCMRELS